MQRNWSSAKTVHDRHSDSNGQLDNATSTSTVVGRHDGRDVRLVTAASSTHLACSRTGAVAAAAACIREVLLDGDTMAAMYGSSLLPAARTCSAAAAAAWNVLASLN
jgi:hypothetical protein